MSRVDAPTLYILKEFQGDKSPINSFYRPISPGLKLGALGRNLVIFEISRFGQIQGIEDPLH